MSGGLFGTSLALNPKCLVFSAFVLLVYWMPHAKHYQHKILIAFLLATLAYVLLAWYDVLFDCNDHLKPTLLGWISMPFKPAEYRQAYNELPLKTKKIVRTFDIVVLVVMVGLAFSPYVL
jgi:threonine/homoserine/homoserine lactone efflux protein